MQVKPGLPWIKARKLSLSSSTSSRMETLHVICGEILSGTRCEPHLNFHARALAGFTGQCESSPQAFDAGPHVLQPAPRAATGTLRGSGRRNSPDGPVQPASVVFNGQDQQPGLAGGGEA